jgi:MarR family transcriptional regulator for hemolysin
MPTSDAHALMELLRQPGMTQNDLADLLGLTKSAVSRLLERLERLGRVSRSQDSGDRRARRLHLTAKGKKLAKEIDGKSLKRFASLLDGIPRDRRVSVLESLELLHRATPQPD